MLALRKTIPSNNHAGKKGLAVPPAAKSGSHATAVLRMKLVGGNPNPQIAGGAELPVKTNYFIGNDPKKWRTNVPTYAKVKYGNVYPGIDLVYYGNWGQLEYDFVVAPGADPGVIRLALGNGGSRQKAVSSGQSENQTPNPVSMQTVTLSCGLTAAKSVSTSPLSTRLLQRRPQNSELRNWPSRGTTSRQAVTKSHSKSALRPKQSSSHRPRLELFDIPRRE